MYKLNVAVTDEAISIIKSEALRYGCSMGAVINIWALAKQKENQALGLTDLYKQLNSSAHSDGSNL